jgi:predicted alpha/beta hydrolase family esterase
MNEISGIPYIEAGFDKNGFGPEEAVVLPAGVTDLIVISHGWNNNKARAEDLYSKFFESFATVAQPNDLSGRQPIIIGVIWPSKEYDTTIAVSGAPAASGGGAALGEGNGEGIKRLEEKLDEMKDIFTEPAQKQLLDEAKALLPDLDEKASARTEFANKMRSLLDPSAASKEDASDIFFKDDGNELMKNLKAEEEDLGEELAEGGVSMPLGVGSVIRPGGGAAGSVRFFSGFKASVVNLLNYTTYYEMKTRSGIVGKNGVAPLIDKLAPQVERIHLIGHSFGSRVVASAALHSQNDKIKSMMLVQAAFSQNGFSKSEQGFFRGVVDDHRVKGPVLITHTLNDKAVGLAYPLASRISGDRTMDFGDEDDLFGAMGRNGAQKMEHGEAVEGKLLPVGGAYTLKAGTYFNLEASDFIKDHNDVKGKELGYLVHKCINA